MSGGGVGAETSPYGGFRILRYRFGRARIDIHVPEDLSPDLVASVVPRYLAPEDESPPDGEIVMLRGAEGWSLALPDGREARFETLDEALTFLEHGTTVAFLGLDSTLFQLHAAGAAVGETALVVLGESGKGKTSIALRWCAHHGLPTLGDDVVLLDEDAVVHPFRRLFRVDPDRAALEPGLPEEAPLLELSPDEKLWVDPEWFGGWADPTPLGLMAWVDREPGADLELQELDRVEALALMLGARFDLAGSEDPDRYSAYVDACLRATEDALLFKITFGDSSEAADRLLSCL